ncbi:nitrous oxide reductase accessory protein NosL [Cytobacillus oceanisediminis]|uniref:nitrous oxide reductase accessory protein NosL n=1 Tax=Cytobacillus oceanisediminis TaxID=665099 RepID=UPI001FB30323|nr:nitrous oxide reductase accessory protein NosL [Cytobacillus oceanisediminis]UOE53070.1 nitrous oxide reductase accessory protein NosL [Cytobacillus oceanisediminis]
MKYRTILLMTVLVILLSACSSSASEPAEIKQNQDSCDNCNMGIAELESAAQLILESGEPVLFDDIGCLTQYIQTENPEYDAAFVHDYLSREWISFEASSFIQNGNIESPMSYGIAAFESLEKAEEYQKKNGGIVYSKEELLKADIKSFKRDGMKHSH